MINEFMPSAENRGLFVLFINFGRVDFGGLIFDISPCGSDSFEA